MRQLEVVVAAVEHLVQKELLAWEQVEQEI